MYNLLIADDSKPDVDCIIFLIQRYELPFLIHTAYDGQEAASQLLDPSLTFDILLTDIKMPYINGLELAQIAKKRFPNIKIILFSGYEDFEYARSAMSIGVSDYLTKPVSVEQYRSALEKAFRELNEISRQKADMREHLVSSNSVSYFDMMTDDLVQKNIPRFLSHIGEFEESLNTGSSSSYSIIYAKYTFMNICKQLIKLGNTPCDTDKLSNDIFNANLIQELITIARELALFVFSDSAKEERDSLIIQRIKEYIAQNYKQSLSLDSIAAYFFMTPNYLCTLFKKETGDNLNRYINNYRLEQATELLCTTNMKIKDIAQATGYQNSSYFCQRFRDTYKESPEMFRQRNSRI